MSVASCSCRISVSYTHLDVYKRQDTKYRYGYGKYESIATLIIATVLMGIGLSLIHI